MSEQEQKKVADLLKQSLSPVRSDLNRDLWPEMLRRLDERSTSRSWLAALFSDAAPSSVPWFDWGALAVLIIGVCAFPSAIPIWLYHF
jgi:hypothetical protein